MKRLLTVMAALALVLVLAAPAMADETPTDRLKAGIDSILQILNDPQYANGQNADQLYDQVSAASDQFFDWAELSRRVVPNHWNEFTPDQQSRFTAALETLLKKKYIRILSGYSDASVDYVRELVRDNRAKVLTTTKSGDKSLDINYMLVNEGQWMVYDISGEGFSLVKNYRSQFNELLASGKTVEDLISMMNDKIAQLNQGVDDENN